MNLLSRMETEGVEQIVALCDPASGLRGFMVLHDTSRGPATGGIRLYPYGGEAEALDDAIRLARAMTFKAQAAELPVGGGKIVLMERPGLERDEVLRAVGRAIETLGGRFLAGRDVGVSVADGASVRSETRYMVDESEQGVGDLNRATALGVEAGARAALAFRTGAQSWTNVRVAIQGAGGVGSWLARLLAGAGAELLVADTNEEALASLGRQVAIQPVAAEAIYEVPADVFAPCAVGGVLDRGTCARLRARVVAGSANNVLAEPEAGDELFARGIAYAPDFLVNAGALIQGVRFHLTGERSSLDAIRGIGPRTASLLRRSRRRGLPPEKLLEAETRARMRAHRDWRGWYLPDGAGRDDHRFDRRHLESL